MRSVRERLKSYRTGETISDNPPRLIDLFCGAGGMTRGFVDLGFVPVWANDFNQSAARTYEANFWPYCADGLHRRVRLSLVHNKCREA